MSAAFDSIKRGLLEAIEHNERQTTSAKERTDMNDWRFHWQHSQWVTLADFPLISLDINPAEYEGGHPLAGLRGNDLLKQATADDGDLIGIKLHMRSQPGAPFHKARHKVRMLSRPGEYLPDEMDRETLMQDAIAFAVYAGWKLPGWLLELYRTPQIDTPHTMQERQAANEASTNDQLIVEEQDSCARARKRRTQHDIAGERGCRRLILENWDAIELLHGARADGRQVHRVIARNVGKGEQTPELKTVQNKLKILRDELLIP